MVSTGSFDARYPQRGAMMQPSWATQPGAVANMRPRFSLIPQGEILPIYAGQSGQFHFPQPTTPVNAPGVTQAPETPRPVVPSEQWTGTTP